MHTKVKEFVDVHYKRYVELNSVINSSSSKEPIDFNTAQIEFVHIKENTVEMQNFLNNSFDDNLHMHRLLYTIFIDVIEKFLLLLDLDIKMFTKLGAKASATGKYGYFEYRKESKIRNTQSNLTLSKIRELIKENSNINIDKFPDDILGLVDYTIYLTTDIKEKYYSTPLKNVNYKAIREELLEFYEKVSTFQCSSDFLEIKKDILQQTREFGLLVRDKITGVEIDRTRQKEIMENLDILRENAYEILLM